MNSLDVSSIGSRTLHLMSHGVPVTFSANNEALSKDEATFPASSEEQNTMRTLIFMRGLALIWRSSSQLILKEESAGGHPLNYGTSADFS